MMTADTDMTENEAEAIRRGNEALRKVAQGRGQDATGVGA